VGHWVLLGSTSGWARKDKTGAGSYPEEDSQDT
jgi:hypothetical protein